MSGDRVGFKRRLQDCGCWSRFVDVRERMKAAQLEKSEDDPERLSDSQVSDLLRGSPEFAEGECCKFQEGSPKAVVRESVPESPSDLNARLFEQARLNKNPQPMRVQVEWVLEVLEDDSFPTKGFETINAAPTMGAYGILKWARTSAATKMEFYKSFATKLMPTKSEIDAGIDFKDVGFKASEKLDQLEKAIADGEMDD